MLYFLFHYILQRLKQLFQSKNYYQQKSKKDNKEKEIFIPYSTQNKKPTWVKDEILKSLFIKLWLQKNSDRVQ